jgi:hypothetical protein
VYVSPSAILKDNFATSKFNQLKASTSGEAPQMQSIILEKMKGG